MRAEPLARRRKQRGSWPPRELEAVAHPGLGDEVLWPCRVRLELAPDLRQVHAEIVRLLLVLRAPHVLEELSLRHELAGIAYEDLDDVPLGGGQPHLDAARSHTLRSEVDREVLGLDDDLLLARCGSAQRGAKAS